MEYWSGSIFTNKFVKILILCQQEKKVCSSVTQSKIFVKFKIYSIQKCHWTGLEIFFLSWYRIFLFFLIFFSLKNFSILSYLGTMPIYWIYHLVNYLTIFSFPFFFGKREIKWSSPSHTPHSIKRMIKYRSNWFWPFDYLMNVTIMPPIYITYLYFSWI